MNPWLIVAALSAVLAAGFGGFKLGVDHETASQAREERLIGKAVEAANSASASAIAGIQVKHTTIRQELEREIRTNTFYAECKHSPVGLRSINDALAKPVGPGSGKLPGADAAGR